MVLRIEDISFIGVYVNDSFRDFKDINDYVNYHVSLLNNKRYQAFSGGDFIDRVVKGGYATDPNYKRALSNVYNQIAKAQEGMKIPKLKGAGELKARILRQFNREKAANRNEEQLIGFDWSRYKSNKPKPETTPTQSEQLENGGIIKYQNPSSGIQRLSQKAIADSLNYGWEGQDNFNKRQSRYANVDPTGNFYSPGDWISNGWRTLWDSSRDNKGTPHEEALYLRYLGGKRDATQLPQTSIRFSRDYDITDNAYPNKEYVGLPKEQKDAIRDNVVTNMQSELKEGVWAQVKDNVRRGRDQRGTGNALSGLGKFGLRNNNNSGIFDIADTYDYPSWIPIPDRNKGYELEIRDTIWTKDAKPELYKVENGYLPYNASPLQKWAKKEVDQLIRRYK